MNSCKKNGLVAYIDLLGFSYLSTNKKEAFMIDKLSIFHKIIKESISNENIHCHTLSDSVFMYCEESQNSKLYSDFIISICKIFRCSIKSGVLLRAGLDIGEFYVTKTDLLDVNLCGSAVTASVNLEKSGKGCRIFTSPDLHSKIDLVHKNCDLIHQYRNFTNYESLDVLEWPYFYKDYIYSPSGKWLMTKSFLNNGIHDLLYDNLCIAYNMIYSEQFDWSIETVAGKVQVVATYEYITSIMDRILEEGLEEGAVKFRFCDEFDVIQQHILPNIKRNQKIADYRIAAMWNSFTNLFSDS